MSWRLILEDFGPELKYIKGENNVVAKSLSRLEMSGNQEILNISELYGYDDKDLLDSTYPIRYRDISKAQETDARLQQKLVSHKDYTLNTFRGGNKDHCLICRNNKICLPTALQKKTVDWYHEMLCHPGETQQSTPSVNILTGKSFSQQSPTCVRNAQHAKEQTQLIRNMANCHRNRLKQIPGTLYV